MYTHWRRPEFSQRFLHNRQLVEQLVRQSSIGKNDLVVEVGPGKGIITQELIRLARGVIAIELDQHLYQQLNQDLAGTPNLKLIHQDFLTWPLPREAYKVFANLPFDVEGLIVRKLINAANPPKDCCLVVRKDVAERWAGISYRGQFSASYRPWFHFAIVHKFRRQDFIPKPKAAAVMLRIARRDQPLLPWSEKRNYQHFIARQFQLIRRPSSLTLNQWIKNYQLLSSHHQVKTERRK